MINDGRTRYADDLTLQELVRLRVENERLRRIIWNLLDDGDETDRAAARAALKGD